MEDEKQYTCAKTSNFDENISNGDTKDLMPFLYGNAAVSMHNIAKLTKRKLRLDGKMVRGFSSETINVYLYLCLHANHLGQINHFSHEDLLSNGLCSDRAVYDILNTLETHGLIKVTGDNYSHYRTILLQNYQIGKKERFLNLNMTFFRAYDGSSDYEHFLALSAGPKSLLLYVLYKFNQQEDSNGNVFEIDVSEFAKYMRVKKPTINRYIRQVNETFGRMVITIYRYRDLTSGRSRFSQYDNRFRYRAVAVSKQEKSFTSIANASLGFWRDFALWLAKHNFRERTIRARQLYDPSSHLTEKQLLQRNRNMFFDALVKLFSLNKNLKDIYETVYKCIKSTGYFDESVTYELYRLSIS